MAGMERVLSPDDEASRLTAQPPPAAAHACCSFDSVLSFPRMCRRRCWS